ncbi:LptF/LptG family permease [Tropicimonas sp. S265A]|uniref:LptF/LptG family permease n=1 Tax=Tropicimonas sp. S265A TaxID=3415134 RepID=UPI003C7A7491
MFARYDRYTLGRLTVMFGFFTVVLVLVFWINRTARLFDRLVGNGESIAVFVEMSALTLPYLVYLILPVCVFAAAIQTGNRMGSDSEIVALQSAGVSAFRTARPAFYLGVMAACLMLVLAHVLIPTSRAQIAELERDLSQDVSGRFLEEGRFLTPLAGITVFVTEITDQGVLQRVLLSDTRAPESQVIYTADEALLVPSSQGPQLLLVSGLAQTLEADGSLSTLDFDNFAITLGSPPSDEPLILRDLRGYQTHVLLEADPDLIRRIGTSKAAFDHELHTRFATPMFAIVNALLGFAALLVGGFSRFGFWYQVAGGIFLNVLLQVGVNIAEDAALATQGAWPVVYAPVAAGFVMVLVMLWLADHPPRFRKRPALDPAGGAP